MTARFYIEQRLNILSFIHKWYTSPFCFIFYRIDITFYSFLQSTCQEYIPLFKVQHHILVIWHSPPPSSVSPVSWSSSALERCSTVLCCTVLYCTVPGEVLHHGRAVAVPQHVVSRAAPVHKPATSGLELATKFRKYFTTFGETLWHIWHMHEAVDDFWWTSFQLP